MTLWSHHGTTCHLGHVLDVLPTLPERSVQCVVTSPPYWGLRDYGVDGQLGLEKTPDEFVSNMVAVFREVRRVLRDDGVCWVNMGDCYAHASSGGGGAVDVRTDGRKTTPGDKVRGRMGGANTLADGLKPKDLCGIPWRLAFALQADGWYLRSEIIWHKPNPMPESVTDRPTKAHEQIFLLTKSARYFYDADAVREPAEYGRSEWKGDVLGRVRESAVSDKRGNNGSTVNGGNGSTGRNLRTVWRIATQSYAGAHFATFPEELAKRCILAGTSERGACSECGNLWMRVTDNPFPPKVTTGWEPTCDCNADTVPCVVMDPFFGSGTVGRVCRWHERNCVGIELNPDYAEQARERVCAPLVVDTKQVESLAGQLEMFT
jgi:DNA modification methylase